MKRLCIDIGNTRSKIGVFSDNELVHLEYCDHSLDATVMRLMSEGDVVAIVFSNVRVENPAILQFLQQSHVVLEITDKTPLPIINNYRSPATLGKDRLAAIVGAHTIFAKSNVMVLNAGTALTIDYLSSTGCYLGGNISMGLQMRFKALHQFTGRLPLVEPNDTFATRGTTTTEALVAGVQLGMIHEINGYIDSFLGEHPAGKVIITGGDGFFFENKIKRTIFARPNLVLEGLHRILLYNEEN